MIRIPKDRRKVAAQLAFNTLAAGFEREAQFYVDRIKDETLPMVKRAAALDLIPNRHHQFFDREVCKALRAYKDV